PITVQICPTEFCGSDCPFCSVAARPIKSRMPWEKVVKVLTDFKTLGAKALEITGGGDPMLYSDQGKDINDVVTLAAGLGYDVGLITNSHNLKRLKPIVHRYLNWVRISLIQLDEGKEPEDYDFNGFPEDRLGFSYIIYETDGIGEMSRTGRAYVGTTPKTMGKIAHLVDLHPQVKFVRLAGDCLTQGDNKRIAAKWKPAVDAIDRWGKFFLKDIQDQDVPFDDGCYVGMIRPYVAAPPEGGNPYQVYICSSYVLENRNYDLTYSLCDVDGIIPAWERMNKRFQEKGYPYQVKGNGGRGWCATCNHCFYKNNNRLIHTVVTELPDKNFA
ncbi:hypothetical protein LCGC14_3057440, partial [marine sediment metagenome]